MCNCSGDNWFRETAIPVQLAASSEASSSGCGPNLFQHGVSRQDHHLVGSCHQSPLDEPWTRSHLCCKNSDLPLEPVWCSIHALTQDDDDRDWKALRLLCCRLPAHLVSDGPGVATGRQDLRPHISTWIWLHLLLLGYWWGLHPLCRPPPAASQNCVQNHFQPSHSCVWADDFCSDWHEAVRQVLTARLNPKWLNFVPPLVWLWSFSKKLFWYQWWK